MLQLSYENWEDDFSETTDNMAFNKFLNIFLRIFYTCFPLVGVHSALVRVNEELLERKVAAPV
jgi:hypothetical protein